MAVKSVIIALRRNAIMTTLPARPIAGPDNTNIDPPIIAAILTITISKRPRDLTN
jgi:hypothetical protein